MGRPERLAGAARGLGQGSRGVQPLPAWSPWAAHALHAPLDCYKPAPCPLPPGPCPHAAEKDASEAWHHLQHMLNKEGALVAAEKGKGKAEDGGPALPAQVRPGGTWPQATPVQCL